jgi:hypothetical protein
MTGGEIITEWDTLAEAVSCETGVGVAGTGGLEGRSAAAGARAAALSDTTGTAEAKKPPATEPEDWLTWTLEGWLDFKAARIALIFGVSIVAEAG